MIFSIFAYRKRGKIPLTPNQIKPKVMKTKMFIFVIMAKYNDGEDFCVTTADTMATAEAAKKMLEDDDAEHKPEHHAEFRIIKRELLTMASLPEKYQTNQA